MLENIDEAVNQQLEVQNVPTPSNGNGSTESPLPATPTTDPTAELLKLRDELAALKSQQAREAVERETQAAELRLKAAQVIAKGTGRVGCVAQDLAFDRLRDTVGGNAFMGKLTPDQKLAALGVSGADTPLKTVKQYFGPGSDAKAANQLANSNPTEYRRLRAVAKAHGIL